jgi:hypothetical protein
MITLIMLGLGDSLPGANRVVSENSSELETRRWNRRSLHRILQSYFAYYQGSRTHLALAKDALESKMRHAA